MSLFPTWMPNCVIQMRTEIRRIQKTLGITSVYVTHDQIEAMTLSDKVVVMNQGVIEQIGTPMEVYRFPSSQFVADFIGRANFAKAVVNSAKKGTLEVTTFGRTVTLTHCRGEFAPKDKITLIIRPEMVNDQEKRRPLSGSHQAGGLPR